MSTKAELDKKSAVDSNKPKFKVAIEKNGPYRVSGKLSLRKETILSNEKGYSVAWEQGEEFPERENYALCRCGRSKNKPYCDGTHVKIEFDGTETASREPYLEQANVIDGPEIVLTDAQNLCAFARFCDSAGGVWQLTQQSDNPRSKDLAIKEACNCPSGRLVEWDKRTRMPFEPELEPSISLIIDPEQGCSGPIWLKGGIPLESSDGTSYEVRNRVTLCRCGKSRNKPFCDGTHASIKFRG